MSNHLMICTDRMSSHVLKNGSLFTPLSRMNYHTNLIPSQIREVTPDNKAILIRTHAPQRRIYLFVKRSFDVIFSGLFIVFVLSWLIPLTGLLILLDSRGPVFFVQR